MNDREVIEELLIVGDYFGNIDQILSRDTQKFDKDGHIIELDLSGLELDELSPTVDNLDYLNVLDLRNNNLVYIPDEIKRLTQLEELYLADNPLQSIPELDKTVRIDVSLPTYSVSISNKDNMTEEKANRIKESRERTVSGIYFPDKTCSWCNKTVGYRKEEQRTDSKWGFTSHVSSVMICLNCSYMHQFYSGRSLFDFE